MTQNRSVWHNKINAGPLLAYTKESYRREDNMHVIGRILSAAVIIIIIIIINSAFI